MKKSKVKLVVALLLAFSLSACADQTPQIAEVSEVDAVEEVVDTTNKDVATGSVLLPESTKPVKKKAKKKKAQKKKAKKKIKKKKSENQDTAVKSSHLESGECQEIPQFNVANDVPQDQNVRYIDGCTELTEDDTYYVLTQDIYKGDYWGVGGANCIYTSSENITIDCQGHSITGIYRAQRSPNFDNAIGIYGTNDVTVKNCLITEAYRGIVVQRGYDITLENNHISNSRNGISMGLRQSAPNDYVIRLANNVSFNNERGLHLAIPRIGSLRRAKFQFDNNVLINNMESDLSCAFVDHFKPEQFEGAGNSFGNISGCPIESGELFQQCSEDRHLIGAITNIDCSSGQFTLGDGFGDGFGEVHEIEILPNYCRELELVFGNFINITLDPELPNANFVESVRVIRKSVHYRFNSSPCPVGSRYASNDESLFCIFENFALPNADEVKPYCSNINNGYLGFFWSTENDSNYGCPFGMRKTSNGEGDSFCVFNGLQLPEGKEVKPYCNYLEDGILGYSWTK